MTAGVLKFHLWKTDAKQQYHWTLNWVSNGQVVCWSENYANKADAEHSLNQVFAHAKDATYEDHTK